MKKWLKVFGMLAIAFVLGLGFKSDAFAAGYFSVFSQTDVSTDSVTISWNDNTGATQYAYALEGGSAPVTGYVQGTSVQITGLNAGWSYKAQVFALDAAGQVTAESYVITVKTLPGKLKKSEFGVAYAYSNINSYSFGVLSGAAATASGWEWQFATASGKVKKTESTTYRLSVTGMINGTFYKYRVRSYIELNGVRRYAPWSAYRTIGALKSGSKYTATKSSLKLKWTKISGAKKYVIYGSKSEKSGFKKIKTVKASKRSLLIKKIGGKKLKKGTKYYFRIIPVAKVSGKSVKADSYSVLYGWTRSF